MQQRVFSQCFVVIGAIIEREGKILLVREAQGRDKGKWNQPAGWLEPGEEMVEATKREVLEETGFVFEPTQLLGIYSLVGKNADTEPGPITHAIKLIYKGQLLSETPQSVITDEISETKWFTPGEIDAMDGATLRDDDIKQEVRDYFAGKGIDLSFMHDTVQLRSETG